MTDDGQPLSAREQLTRICGPLADANVFTMRDARDHLTTICDLFSEEPGAPAIAFGAHRKPEAVLLPYGRYLEMTGQLRQLAAASALGSVRAEGLDVTEEAEEILNAWMRGEISADQMRHLVRSMYATDVTTTSVPPV